MIIGAGGAGARAAVEAARLGKRVTLVCRSPLGRGGLTPTANGGYHAAVWPGDSPAIHAEDLVRMGCHVNDRDLVRVLTEEAVPEAHRLEELGAKINWDVPPKPAEPQMRSPRSLFVPGKVILSALRRHLKAQDHVLLLEDHLAIRLLTRDGEVAGAVLFHMREGNLVVCESKATILATGSMGEIYPLTAQEPMGIPTGSTGSGYVFAALAGADLVDMEMIQFSAVPVVPPLVQGMRCLPWAAMLNGQGKEFLPSGLGEYSHEAAQSICRELREGRGPVWMDLRGQKPSSHSRHPLFGRRNELLQELEVTPYQQPVEVGVGALFMMGGIHINERCETLVPRLYAAGEVSGNVHGARRVSGNAFPEMIVFGARAGRFAAQEADKRGGPPGAQEDQIRESMEALSDLCQGRAGDIAPREMRQAIRQIMGTHAHVFRNGEGIKEALVQLRGLERNLPSLRIDPVGGMRYNPRLIEALDVRWLLHTAQIVCRAALQREESRGFHFREDFPEARESWLRHTVVRRVGAEWVSDSKPIVM